MTLITSLGNDRHCDALGHKPVSSAQNISQNKAQEEVSSNGRLFNSCILQNFFCLYLKQVAFARIKGSVLESITRVDQGYQNRE